MRVIAGTARGILLRGGRTSSLRPTPDMVRESLFDILGERVVDARVLDLFAGTGALGIEALSRGAQHATFVENNRQALSLLRANLEHTHLGEHARVLAREASRALAGLARAGCRFDLILADPPYDFLPQPWLARLTPLCNPDTLVVYQHGPGAILEAPGFRIVKQRRYGDTVLTFLAPVTGSAPNQESR